MSLAIDRDLSPNRKPRRKGYLRDNEWYAELARKAREYGEVVEPVPAYTGESRLKARLNARRRREQEVVHAR